VGDHYQFQRIGYFTPDKDSTAEQLIFNRPLRKFGFQTR